MTTLSWKASSSCHRLFGSISSVQCNEIPDAVTIAWVQSIRRHKTRTFLNINDGTSPDNVQVGESDWVPFI